ncbi:Hypothetical protein SCF082_LOCUS27964 [Durusdinium trenchii]|uniref:Calcineurin-like phosphoesterase domain-containing protein n=1 Tax=Durusdinium trenchii TaxID=1381693 RepID=A0ABP0MH25_9DINO
MAQKCDIFLCLSLFRRSLAALEIFQKKPSNAVQKYFMWRVNLWLAASMHGVEGEPFPEGSVCWVRDSAVMTEKEDLSSVKKKDIPGASKGLHSARLLVLGHGRSKSRLRVQDSSGDVGWVSTTLEGRLLLQPSSAWLTVSETHEKEAVYQAMQKLWHAHKAAQEQGANLASELLAAHHQAVQQDAIRWRQEQDIAELEDELDEEEKVCKSFKRKVKELELSIAKEEQRNGEEKQIQALEERNSTRLKSELAEFESEAGRLRIELEDSRAALRTAQLERRSKEEQHESRISALTGLMHEEVNKAHERLTVTEMATTAAQRTLQLVEDEEAGKTSKSADELNRMKDYVRAESEAFDKCEFKLESIEKREKTRSLFENVQVEFLHKEKRTNDELREATLLRNEAAQAADEALALRIRLAREDQDLTSRQASLSTAEQQASQKLELAAVELDRARILTQELTKDKAEAFSELAEARRVSGRAQQERELAHQQSLEAEMAAFEAMKACEAADEDRKKVEQALLSVTEDLEKAARQQREGLELAAKGESSLHRMHMIEEKVSQYSEENQRLSQDLKPLLRFPMTSRRSNEKGSIGRGWAQELQKRTVPCLAEQQEVERCYAAPPGGDQLRCGPVVDAYVFLNGDHARPNWCCENGYPKKFPVGGDPQYYNGITINMTCFKNDTFDRYLAQLSPEVINVGDNFYWGGVDCHCGNMYARCDTKQWKWIYEEMWKGPGIDGKQWLGVLGNHDWGGWQFNKGWDQVIAYSWGGLAESTGRWLQPSIYWAAPVRMGTQETRAPSIDFIKSPRGGVGRRSSQ